MRRLSAAAALADFSSELQMGKAGLQIFLCFYQKKEQKQEKFSWSVRPSSFRLPTYVRTYPRPRHQATTATTATTAAASIGNRNA